MYERINGKLYKLVDESAVMVKFNELYEKFLTFTEGVKTCERSITSFEAQKQKYIDEINNLCVGADIDKEIVKQVVPDKAKALGF